MCLVSVPCDSCLLKWLIRGRAQQRPARTGYAAAGATHAIEESLTPVLNWSRAEVARCACSNISTVVSTRHIGWLRAHTKIHEPMLTTSTRMRATGGAGGPSLLRSRAWSPFHTFLLHKAGAHNFPHRPRKPWVVCFARSLSASLSSTICFLG